MKNSNLKPVLLSFKRWSLPLLLSLSALSLSAELWAQTPQASETPQDHTLDQMRSRAVVGGSAQAMAQKMHDNRLHRFEQGQAELKKQLNLTAVQEPLWQSFVQAVRPSAPQGAPLDRAQMKEIAQLPAPQRAQRMMELHEARHDQRLAQMKAHLEAMKVFYAQLSPEQQKTFDQVTWKHHHQMMRFAKGMPRPA